MSQSAQYDSSTTETRDFAWLVNLMGLVLFAFAVSSVCARAHILRSTPGQVVDSRFDAEQGYRDFHNAIYFPVRAFLSGVNPYSEDYVEYHPDELSFPLFSPTTLLLHAPLGFFQLQVAEVVWMSCNVILLLWISYLMFRFCRIPYTWGGVFLVAGLMIMCRPGLLNFFGVQVTLMHMLGCMLALEYARSNPILAGFGVMLAFSKPTFAIPLAIMLLFRRNLSAFAAGAAFCAVSSLLTVGIISSQCGGLKAFADQAIAQYGTFEAHPEIPEVVSSWTRLDLYSVLIRWFELPAEINWKILVPVGVLGFGAFCMLLEQNRNQREGVASRTGIFALLIILTSVYHQPYDALILWLPLAALLMGAPKMREAFNGFTRLLLALLLLVPMYNFLSAKMFLDRLKVTPTSPEWKAIVTANGIAIALAALLVGLRMVFSVYSNRDRDAMLDEG